MRLLSRLLLLLAIPAWLAAAQAPGLSAYNVRDHGARGDGRAKDTRAIQQAVEAAHAAGGGQVYFPPGTYLSGTVFLKSGVTLHLESGATLLGSPDSTDYPHLRSGFRSYTDRYVDQALLWAEDQERIGLAGRGTIDGNGQAFQWKDYGGRPDVIRFINCRHILVEDLRLQNSALWMQHYLGCEFVTIRGIHVWNHSTWNNDMIDIDCCRNVIISDCYGHSDDDALTLKSTADRPTENVTITNCVLGSGCNAIKMGTESNGGFRNISITNCVIDSWLGKKGYYGLPKGIGGVVLEIVDGGTLENVTISNISMKNVMVPLFLRFGNRARPFKEGMAKPGIGAYRNVVISNITARDADLTGCSITGLPGHPLRGVTLSNLRLSFPGGGTREDFLRPVEELEDQYPEAFMFGTLPAYAFYCRHVDGLRIENLDLELEGEDGRPALVFDDVENLELDGLSERRPGASAAPLLVLKDVRGAGLRACRPLSATPVFMLLQGAVREVSVIGNDLRRAARLLQCEGGADSSAVFSSGNRLAD